MARHARTARPTDTPTPAGARGAFTLTELVVAVGAAAILTASVGVLFRSVGDLTSAGVAATELDQVARVIERQMRDDISAFNRLPADQAFLAIRFREVGDIDRNGAASADGERPIYLREADRQADVVRFPAVGEPDRPYRGDGTTRGRGVTTRVDEVIFLGKGTFVSAQGASAASAHARISWGHGLKPLPDPNPALDPDAATGLTPAARRMNIPDGDFGSRSGEPFSYLQGIATAGFEATGRNEYATDWPLARHTLLLYGGAAISNSSRPFSSPLPEELTFAPYIRDQESQERFAASGGWSIPAFGRTPTGVDVQFPDPRFVGAGRTDIAAQSITDVRRWLEGDPPLALGLQNTATAYSEGWLADPTAPENLRLWVRDENDRALNLRLLQSAIAGVFARPLVEDRPPVILPRRFDPGATNQAFREPPEASMMDLHALVASRCSRFEVAWNDGTVAIADIDVNGDGDPDYRAGDRIWFDISPILNASGQIIRRSTYADWRQWGFSNPRTVRFARLDADNPEIIQPDVIGASTLTGPSISFLDSRWYDPGFTGGSLLPNGNFGPEAFAIWGFRTPLANGDYAGAWPKPTLLRVRMTLHDAQLRSPEGKTYEFVYSLSNAR